MWLKAPGTVVFFPFIKKTSMVTADIFTGRVYILRRRGILQFTLSQIRHPHPTSAWFTRTKLPPTFWHWALIRGLEFCEYFIAFQQPVFSFQWNASRGERIQSFLRKTHCCILLVHSVNFVFKHYRRLLLKNNCVDGSCPEDTFLLHWFHVLFFFLIFWLLSRFFFGQRLNDTSVAYPDKHTTYQTLTSQSSSGGWLDYATGCVSL